MVLPIFRTLRYYRNYIKPTCSFNTDLIKNLTEETEGVSEQERYVKILIDEMKIQRDLVWEKSLGESLRFADLGSDELNFATFQDTSQSIINWFGNHCNIWDHSISTFPNCFENIRNS